MFKELILDFSRVTEQAAIVTAPHVGKGKKEVADAAAVKAMRDEFLKIPINGVVVSGEGTIDEAPMLYHGEKVGKGGPEVEIAVDPIDGTRMVALGQDNAVAVLAVAQKGSLLPAPDMYMEKLMVNDKGFGTIDLNKSIEENVQALAKKLDKPLNELKIMTLAKERHENVIKTLQELGCTVIAIPDGDVEASVMVATDAADVDMYYGIGGAPEGIINAAVLKALGGDMQARFVSREECKGCTLENTKISQQEIAEIKELGFDCNTILTLDDLVKSEELIVSMTGITDGTVLQGCKLYKDYATTETLLIRGRSRTIRKMQTRHLI